MALDMAVRTDLPCFIATTDANIQKHGLEMPCFGHAQIEIYVSCVCLSDHK